MKNKNGFTVVELIASFSLAMAIAIFLFQIVALAKNMYVNSGVKTQLLSKQSTMNNYINERLMTNNVRSVVKCGSYCLKFIYSDGSVDELIADKNNNTLQFGNYKISLVDDSYFGNMSVVLDIVPTFSESRNNGMITIDIPIYNDALKDENFGISAVYQFNTNTTNISEFSFDADNGSGYILLKGSPQVIQYSGEPYTELGFTAYDNNGNVINSSNVRVTNPLSTTPYTVGTYEIKYELLDSSKNVLYTTFRTIKVVS